MIKKIAVGAVLVALGLGFLQVTGLSSYPATAFGKVKKTFKKNVPLEFEVERLHYQVAQLVPDMRKHLSTIAEEMVAVGNLKEEIAQTHINLDKQKANILAMTKDLETGARTVSYGGREYSADRVRDKLARDFASYKTAEVELKTREKLLDAREKSLDAARDQLATMKSQKQDLELQVAQLESELKTVRAAQARSKFQIDDSNLARCKATLQDIRNRLKSEKIQVDLEGEFANDPIPVEKKAKPSKELISEINGHFDRQPDDSKVASERK